MKKYFLAKMVSVLVVSFLSVTLGVGMVSAVEINTAPVAEASIVTTNEDTATSSVLIASDEDVLDVLVYSIVDGPIHGALSDVNSATGGFTYTPYSDYFGSDSFTFKVNDGTEDSNVATVSITVNSVNDAPVASADVVVTNEDIAVVINLGATDTETASEDIVFATSSNPLHGIISLVGNSVTYTPALNYYGLDSFTFTAYDGETVSDPATISITVNPVNDAPVITLNGAAYLLYTTGFPWVDLSATAIDIEDGDISDRVVRTGALDMSTVGEYTLTYSVTDSGRNTLGGEEGNGVCPEEGEGSESCLSASTVRVVGIVPRTGGIADTRVGCTDSLATNYDVQTTINNVFLCTYAPKGNTPTTTPATPVAPLPAPVAGTVLGESTSCKASGFYLTKFAREGYKNDEETVKKLQTFLNSKLSLQIPVTGVFGPMTTEALKKFQLLHKDTMLTPWNLTVPTGILYLTTLASINNIICAEFDATVPPKDLIPFNQNPNAPKR